MEKIYNNYYTVYHCHTDISNTNGFMDSCSKYEDYIKLAKQNNMKAIAFSEHGNMYEWIKKKQSCDKAGIKYIHGIETYLCEKFEDNVRGYHIGLYAKNWKGVQELNALISKASSKGIKEDKTDRHFYFNARISLEELFNTSPNIIITTACLASILWKLSKENMEYLNEIKNNKNKSDNIENINNSINKNKEIIHKLLSWMSKNNDRTFLEIQYHNCSEQKQYNKLLYKWSKDYNIKLIAGTDTHSANQYKAECRSILQTAKNPNNYDNESEFDLTFKSYKELVNMFKIQNALPSEAYLEAIENTNLLADMVEDFELDKTFKYPTLYGNNANEIWKKRILKMFKDKCENGVIDKKQIHKYKNQIKEEFKVMTKLGMESFMIFMSELMVWAKQNNINSSPCRGSVGGSLIAFITDIISVDPIKWKTVFSRFCNEDRISLGDIDEDFAPDDRPKVYQYIIDRFGNKNVSYILTLGTVQDRGSIDVLAKGLKYNNLDLVKDIKNSFDDYYKEFSKIIIEEVNLEELEEKTSSSPTFDDVELYYKRINKKNKAQRILELKSKWDKLREDNKELFYYFDGIKGVVISKGNHPSGMIGSPITLPDNLGVFYKGGDENIPVSSCAMKSVDSLNYVKFDILGLKTIGILQDTYKLIGKRWEEPHQIDWNDNKVWKHMIDSNAGVFQFEGKYAFDLLKKFKPTAINDMSLVNASLRPSGKSYRDRLLSGEFNKNPSKEIDDLLKENNGFLVFQEDTIKFLTDICGFSGSLADTTRRCIGKKDKEGLKQQLPKILEGYCNKSSKSRENAEKEAKEFIQIISDSSEYQFGYNHSTGYSMNGYMCARLRYYYPLEFTTAYLNNVENEDDINMGTDLANTLNIKIMSPKFRYSKAEYMFDKKTNSIYKGVKSIKYLNEECANQLYELRNNEYNTFLELLVDLKDKKINMNSRQLEILIKLDYFSEFGKSKKLLKIVEDFDNIYGKKQISKKDLEKYNINSLLLEKYSNKITAKLYKEIDTLSLLKEKIKYIKDEEILLKDKLSSEIEYLGYPSTIIDSLNDPLYYTKSIDKFENKKGATYYLNLYNIKNGEDVRYKITNYEMFSDNCFTVNEGNIIKINQTEQKPKKRKNKDTGGWEIIPNEFNTIILDWEVY